MAQGLHRYTEHTIVSLEDFVADLKVAHERGFAISQAEYEDGIHAVAAPILDTRQRPVAVVALAGPAFRLPLARMIELGPHVRQCADDISREIGLAAALTPDINHTETLHKARLIKPDGDDALGT
jgi:IclR family acetate operon transcriptional repressor